MNKNIYLAIGVLVIVSLACSFEIPPFSTQTIKGSGNVISKEEAITDFEKVDISHAFKVKITQGEAYNVVIRVDDNLVEHLVGEKQGSTLKIGLKPGRSYTNTTLEAEITMPELTGLELSGASDATISGFKSSNNLDVAISGASSLNGDIEAGGCSFDLSGSSQATLSGSGVEVTIDASGSSDIDLSNFPLGNVKVEASGSSSVIVNASGNLDADASGASNVYYLGNPSLGKIDTSGSSSVEPK